MRASTLQTKHEERKRPWDATMRKSTLPALAACTLRHIRVHLQLSDYKQHYQTKSDTKLPCKTMARDLKPGQMTFFEESACGGNGPGIMLTCQTSTG